MSIALLYTLLAIAATALNLAAQDALLRLYTGPGALQASVLWGTAVGLIAKYYLDKRFIFRVQTRNAAHDGQTFVLYSAMGLITTAVFWGMEAVFHHYSGGQAHMRYLGGALGLALGYWLKYHLDKHFVFTSHNQSNHGSAIDRQ